MQHEAWQAGGGADRRRRRRMVVQRFSVPSDNLLDAGSLEAAGAALLLDLTG